MPDLPSRLDYRDIGRASLARANAARKREQWDVALADTDGSTESLMIGAASAIAWHLTMQLTQGASSVFLDASSEQLLDRWGINNYQETRKIEAQAVGYLLLQRPAQTITPGTVVPPNPTTTITTVGVVSGNTSQTSTVSSVPSTTTDFKTTNTLVVVTAPDGSTSQTQTVAMTQELTSTDPGGTGDVVTTATNSLATQPTPLVASTPDIIVDNDLPPGTIASGTKFTALDGSLYQATDDVSFAEGQTEALVRIQAELPGKTQQQGTNSITAFVNNADRFDPALTVTNPEPTAGGEPAQSDASYRARLRAFWNAARRSTLLALDYGAIKTPGVESANSHEIILPVWDVNDGRHDFPEAHVEVDLSIADSSGVSNQALQENADAELRNYKAGGIDIYSRSGTPFMVSVVLALSFRAGVNTITLTSKVRSAVVAAVNSLGVNSPLLLFPLSQLLVQFEGAGLIVPDTSIVQPATDVFPPQGTTIRTQLDMVLLVQQV